MRRVISACVCLALLSPLMVELLLGSTGLSKAFLLPTQVAAYGGAALFCRAVVRRRSLGWGSLVVLGVAYAVTEELLFLQTSFGPSPWGDPHSTYGLWLDINWPYFLFMLGYESLWSIVLPVVLVEVLFHDIRADPWLGRRGTLLVFGVYVLGAAGAWYLWTQRAVPAITGAPAVPAPIPVILAALIGVALLGILALRWPFVIVQDPTWSAPRPIVAGLLAFGLSLAWCVGFVLSYAQVEVLVVVGWYALVAAGATALSWRWARRAGWTDQHSVAIVLGALTASMAFGVLTQLAPTYAGLDRVGKAVLDGLALVGLVVLLARARRATVSV